MIFSRVIQRGSRGAGVQSQVLRLQGPLLANTSPVEEGLFASEAKESEVAEGRGLSKSGER